MRHYTSQSLSAQERYKLISGSLIPRPIAWVTTLGSQPDPVINLAPFSFFSALPAALPILSLAIGRKNGQPKDTANNLLDNEEAVIHIVDQPLAQDMNKTAASLPPGKSELDLIPEKTIPSRSVAVPSLLEPKIRFETKLYQYGSNQG
nr:flavin reductase family protein [Secundilactobacillus folii]